MKAEAFCGITLTLLSIGILTLPFDIQPAKANGTIYIKADGRVDPPTANIASFDNVTYTFTGNIINCSIVVERDNIVVEGAGYTIQGAGAYGSRGIDLSYRSNLTIKDMKVRTFDIGIYLYYSSSNSISGNNITNNSDGILLDGSSNYNSISGNNITNNSDGILLDDFSNYNSISGNNITSSEWDGIWLDDSANNNTISGNDITKNQYGIVLVGFSQYNSVSGNNIADNGYGIWLEYSSNNTILGNNMAANNEYGIYLYDSSNNSITGNNITNSIYDVYLERSSNNVLRSNNMTGNKYNFGVSGRELSHFVHDVDSSNTVNGKPIYYWVNRQNLEVPSDAGYVALVNSENITVKELELKNNGQGMLLANSNNSRIIGNNIADNGYGIWLDSSSDNRFFHNNFVNNTQQVHIETSGYPNLWDGSYPSGGNFWSDYTDEDLYSGPAQNESGSDGVWDHPYVTDPDNQDNYPLTNPWGDVEPPVADAGSDLTVAVGTTVTFDSSKSIDDVAIKSYVWTFTDITPQTLTGMQPKYAFNNVGDFEVTLNVSDYAGNWNTDVVTITVLLDYTLRIYSSPTEVTFTVDDVSRTTPWSGTYAENTSLSLVVPETYTLEDARYYWNHWSDGNTSRSRIITMTTILTLTAYYTGPYYGYELTITSSPVTGITFTVNGTPETTPYTEWLPEGFYTLEMPQTHNGYVWSHWLEDGDTNRTKTVTIDTEVALTAVFACTFDIVLDDIHYPVYILSNSTISNFNFNETRMQISFDATTKSGTTGYCNITIPKSLLKGPWTIRAGDSTIAHFDETTNDTYTFLYFTYIHENPLQIRIKGTWVVPEFPSTIILPLFMITLLAVTVYACAKKPCHKLWAQL